MKLKVINQDGGKGSTVTVDDSVFGIKPNESVVHQAVVAELANSRQGTHSSKNRSAVSGGGKKPFKQKGTGRARQGTTRAAQMRHGGVAHGPQPHDYNTRINKKERRRAVAVVLSDALREGRLIVVKKLALKETLSVNPLDVVSTGIFTLLVLVVAYPITT